MYKPTAYTLQRENKMALAAKFSKFVDNCTKCRDFKLWFKTLEMSAYSAE